MQLKDIIIVSAIGLGACGGPSQSGAGDYTLPGGGSAVIVIPSETPMLVTFGFETGSPSWEAASACPERNVGDAEDPFMMRICGGLYDANIEPGGYASHFEGMHGGGVSFQPKDGVVRVRLENHAGREMTFQIEAEAVV